MDSLPNTNGGENVEQERMPIMELSVPTSAVSSVVSESKSNDEDIDNEDLEDPDDASADAVITSTISEEEDEDNADDDDGKETKRVSNGMANKKSSATGGDGRPTRQKRMPRTRVGGNVKEQDMASSRGVPSRTKSSKIVEAPSSTKQTEESKRAQWKNSLDISSHT